MTKTLVLLLAEIEAFLDLHDIKPTVFGIEVCNDGHLVHDLRAGRRDLRTSQVDRVREFMRTYRPKRQREMA